MVGKYAAKSSWLSNGTYDALKWVALVALPAFGAFYLSLSDIWNLPYATQVVATSIALDTLLGILLGLASNKYKNTHSNGTPIVGFFDRDSDGIKRVSIESPLEVLEKQDEVVLKLRDITPDR